MGLKKTQPGPKYKTPQGPEKGDRKDRSSEDGNKPASSKRENLRGFRSGVQVLQSRNFALGVHSRPLEGDVKFLAGHNR